MSDSISHPVVVVQSAKSPGLAAALGFLFGPLGVLYVGWLPALVLLVVCVPLVAMTAGFGLFITAPACAVVAYTRAGAFNRQLLNGAR